MYLLYETMAMEREEGELTDEDLEDVSDSSIVSLMLRDKTTIPTSREPFRELSLTSISDEFSEHDAIIIPSRHKRYNYEIHRKRSQRHESQQQSKRFRTLSRRKFEKIKAADSWKKQYSSLSSSSDSEGCIPDRKTLKQLRYAVRINTSRDLPNCSLSTRIKHMIQPTLKNDSDEDIELEALRNQALQSKAKNDAIESVDSNASHASDDDLVALRLVALQSAVLKKHAKRRKKKEQAQEEVPEENMQTLESAAQDGQPAINPALSGQKDDQEIASEEIKSSTTAAGVPGATSSVKDKPENSDKDIKSSVDEDEDILRAMLLTSISKKIANKKAKLIEKEPATMKSTLAPMRITRNHLETKKNSVKFPLMPVKRLVINVNTDSDSDYEQTNPDKKMAGGGGAKSTELFNKSLSLFLKQARANSEADPPNDILKHLPHSQQLEYKQLKRKLYQLSKMQAHSKTKQISDENAKGGKKNVCKVRTSNANQETRAPGAVGNNRVVNNSERLQIRGKYEELTPLTAKVSEARAARDIAQVEVKRLINELRVARARLTTTHQNYTVLVQQLVNAKAVVDKRANMLHCSVNQEMKKSKQVTNALASKPTNAPAICTSTPNNKSKLKEVSIEISEIINNTSDEVHQEDNNTVVEVTVPALQEAAMDIMQGADIAQVKDDEKGNNKLQEYECEPMEIEDCEPETEERNKGIEAYVSPLNHISNNRQSDCGNPLAILCPYDLLGICRDPDCTYRHCTKAVTD